MTTITRQYLDSGTYEVVLEESLDLDINSYVYTRFGTFVIVPVLRDETDFKTFVRYDVLLENMMIGEVNIIEPGEEDFDNLYMDAVTHAMASAIDIVSNKITEFIDSEERAILAKIVNDIIDGINLSEEQKAMYRTFLIEQDTLDDVIQEIETPTDVFGDKV